MQSGQLLNTFLSTYKQTKTGAAGLSISKHNSASKPLNLNVVREDQENDSAVTVEEVRKRDLEDNGDSDDEYDWGRSPERVDLDQVDVTSPSKKRKPSKPLVSKEEAQEILER